MNQKLHGKGKKDEWTGLGVYVTANGKKPCSASLDHQDCSVPSPTMLPKAVIS